MSAALQFPALARTAAAQRHLQLTRNGGVQPGPAACSPAKSQRIQISQGDSNPDAHHVPVPVNTLAFYRKHTHKLLRRYLYASMLVGRSPSILTEPLVRGWASSRPVKSFEDCVIFVLDMEKALARLSALDRVLLKRIVLQEYTLAETALLLSRSERLICGAFAEATDRLTGILLETGILKLPHRQDGAPNPNLDD
jgi:hypothetical protein